MFKNSKLVCILVLATLLAALLPVSCAGAEAALVGTTWYGCYQISIYDDQTCVIVGYHDREDRTKLVIPEKLDKYDVVGIGEKAFYENSYLKKVTIPNSVTWIGNHAFYMSSLSEVVLPDQLKSIGASAFYKCYNLKSITFPNTLEIIGEFAFTDCKLLQKVEFPSSLHTIGDKAFLSCHPSLSVVAPASIIFIGNDVFWSRNSTPTVSFTVEKDSYMHLYCKEFGFPFVIK